MKQIHEQYVNCIKRELKEKYESVRKDYNISTIYIGGGTPSFIDSKYIKDILSIIKNKSENNEITIEVNPGTVNEQKIVDYKNAGINRLSIGLQSTSNKLLQEIGRIHTFEQFLETYNLARKVGFTNINVDLMLGLPNQTIQDLKQSLEDVIKLKPEHISVYSLILEENTKLFELVNEEKLDLPNEKLERQMYWYVKNTLELNGYKHYEISNFAKIGFESKHNTNCWKQCEYIGIGLGASSYLDGTRYSNIGNLNEYMQNLEIGDDYKFIENMQNPNLINFQELNKNIIIEEVQKEADMQRECILLGLRMLDGVSIKDFKNKFTQNPLFVFRKEIDKLVNAKLVIVDGDKIKLTNKGLDLANKVWTEFV